MFTFLVIVQIITCIALVIVVLLQQGKGAEIGAVFGSSEAIFGSAGPAPFLAKVTAVLATIFMCTSIALTYLSAHQNTGSVMQGVKQQPINMPAPAPTLPSKAPSTTTTPVQTTPKAESPTTSQNVTQSLNKKQPVVSTNKKSNQTINTINAKPTINSSKSSKAKTITKTKQDISVKSQAVKSNNSTSLNKTK